MTIFAYILVLSTWLMVGYNLESLRQERNVNIVYNIRSAPVEIETERMVIYADDGYAMEK